MTEEKVKYMIGLLRSELEANVVCTTEELARLDELTIEHYDLPEKEVTLIQSLLKELKAAIKEETTGLKYDTDPLLEKFREKV